MKYRKIIIIAITFIFFFILGYIGYRIYNQNKINKSNALIEKLKEENRNKYLELIEKQEKASLESDSKITPFPTKILARGRSKVKLLLIRPPEIAETEIQSLTSRLKSGTVSLNYINTYLDEQKKNYNVSDFQTELEILGPFVLKDLPYAGDIINFWDKDPFNIIKLQDTFETVIEANNLDVSSDDLVLYLYFDNSQALTDDNPYSFYEYKKFRSFAQPETKRAFVNIYRFGTDFAPTVVEIATHELLHLYGANDKYEEKNPERICSERGRGIPDTLVYIPQTTGDIMCSYIEYEEGKFKRGDFFGGTLIINPLTASEIGWLKSEF